MGSEVAVNHRCAGVLFGADFTDTQVHHRSGGANDMLWTISVSLFTVWFLGVLMSYTFDGYLHILLGITIVITVVQVVRRRKDLGRLRSPIQISGVQTRPRAQSGQRGV